MNDEIVRIWGNAGEPAIRDIVNDALARKLLLTETHDADCEFLVSNLYDILITRLNASENNEESASAYLNKADFLLNQRPQQGLGALLQHLPAARY